MSEVMKLPKIQDLVLDANEAFKNDQFKLLVNQQPPASWIKVNKFANNSQYVPIDKIEYLLDKIIQHWKIEILETKQMFNSVMVSVRVHYKHPIDNNWYFHDGVACKELQTKKDSGILKPDFSNLNSGAIEMAAPIAKTMAIKDACDHIGRIFGRDLNRKEILSYIGTYEQPLIDKQEVTDEEIKEAIHNATDFEDLKVLQRQHPKISVNGEMMSMIAKKKIQFSQQ